MSERKIDIRQSIEYQQGYHEGYVEANNKANERLINYINKQLVPITIKIENKENIKGLSIRTEELE